MPSFVSLVDEEENIREETRRSGSWGGQVMDGGGGLPGLPEEEAQGLLCEVYPFYLVWFSLST